MSADAETFCKFCEELGLAKPVTELKFDPARSWRFDFAWPETRVALEVEGGGWIGGRHTSGAGFAADMDKYSEAAAQGWLIIRRPPVALFTVKTISYIRRAQASR